MKQCSQSMKRKLSLGMAIIGGTQTIVIDEPTAGVEDTESREQIWDMIRKLKETCSIVVST